MFEHYLNYSPTGINAVVGLPISGSPVDMPKIGVLGVHGHVRHGVATPASLLISINPAPEANPALPTAVPVLQIFQP